MAKNLSLATEADDLMELDEGDKPEPEALDILSELGATPGDDTWRFTVAHVLGASKDGVKEPQIYEGDASIMEGLHTRLREQFGQGRFRVRVYKNKRLYARKDIEVASAPRPIVEQRPNSEMATVLTAFQQQAERTNQLLERLLTPQPQMQLPVPTASPLSAIKEIAGVMVSLKEMMTPPQAQTVSTVDAILKGVELAKSVSDGGGNAETNIMDIIKEAVRGAMPVLISQAQAGQPMAGPQPAPDNKSLPVPQGQPGTPQTPDANAQMMQEIRQNILYLCGKAQKNADTELYAELVLDDWPRERVVGILGQNNAVPLLLQIAPEAQPFISWFQKLIVDIKEMLQDEAVAPMPMSPGVSPNASTVSDFGNSRRDTGGGSNFEEDDRFGA